MEDLTYLSTLKYAEKDSRIYEGLLSGHQMKTVVDSYTLLKLMSIDNAKIMNTGLKIVVGMESELGD